jgi:hypothetical protein
MPLNQALEGGAFGPEKIKVMAATFDEILCELKLVRTHPLAEVIASKIVECAKTGESDPKQLREMALKRLPQSRG